MSSACPQRCQAALSSPSHPLWHAQVNPNIRKAKWSDDEDRRLLKLVKQYGNAWAEISRCLDGRTDQQVHHEGLRLLDLAATF